MMKSTFVDNGIPVIIGEYGCPDENKEPESVMKFLTSVCEAAYSRNMCPVLWDTPGGRYDRTECKMANEELNKRLCEIAGSSIKSPENDGTTSVTYQISDLKTTSKGEYIVPLRSNAKNLTKAVISLSVTSSENSGWFCGGGALTFDSVKAIDGTTFWSSKSFNYDGGKEKVLINFDGKFKDEDENEYEAFINCSQALLVDWWHSSEKYPDGGNDVSCEYKSITLYYSEAVAEDIIKGDTNCDKAVNVLDFMKSVEVIMGTYEFNDSEFNNADINSDGKFSIIDVILLKNILITA